MKINRNKLIAGQTADKIRAFCRQAYFPSFSAEFVAHFFGKDITTELRKARLIKPSTETKGAYMLAAEGTRWVQALFLPRISRPKAERMVTDMLARAELINSDPDLVYSVHEIHAFGSYVTRATDLGDVDLIIHWGRRPLPAGFDDYSDWVRERAYRAGKDGFYVYDYAMDEVRQRLRARNPYLSFHDQRQHEKLRKPAKRIFQAR